MAQQTVTVTYPTRDPHGNRRVVETVAASLTGVEPVHVYANLRAGTVAIAVPQDTDPQEIAKALLQGADYQYTVG